MCLVCDFLRSGYGGESKNSRNQWFELQKLAISTGFAEFLESASTSVGDGEETERETRPSTSLGIPSPATYFPVRTQPMAKTSALNLHGSTSNGNRLEVEAPNTNMSARPKPTDSNNVGNYGSTSQKPVVTSQAPLPPDGFETRMKHLERHLDDVLSINLEHNNKVLEQNTQLLSKIVDMGDEIDELRHPLGKNKLVVSSLFFLFILFLFSS